MKKFNYNGYNFHRFSNLFKEKTRNKLKSDIDYQIETNLCTQVKPYQTYDNLHEIYFDKTPWALLSTKITNCVTQIYPGVDLKKVKVWANVSKEDNSYDLHTHDTDLTAVYYLKNKYPEYGTNIENNIVVNGFENSLIVFDGSIKHGIVNMPIELAKNNYRYSIVIDYNYV